MKATIGILLGAALVAGSFVTLAPVEAQAQALVQQQRARLGIEPGRLCLRADQRSLITTTDEGEDAYLRAAALGNRCYTALGFSQRTLLPVPQADPLDTNNYYFLSRAQRQAINPALGLPVNRP